MPYRFNDAQFKRDQDDFLDYAAKFLKSFGPSQKKVAGKPIGFWEEMHTRFRLHIVEMGISKVIRTVLVLIVGLITYVVFFRNASTEMRVIIAFLFILYFAWQFADHLKEDIKDGSMVAGIIVGIQEQTFAFIDFIKESIGSIFSSLNPFKK